MQAATAFFDVCSTSILRSTNGVLAVICSLLIYEIIIQLRPALDDRRATCFALVLALYPLHWFFTFLYYTDVASLTAVLAMYLACLKKKYLISALLGALAVFIRQTNIIWMLFVACIAVINCTLAPQKDKTQFDDSEDTVRNDRLSVGNEKGLTLNSTLRKRTCDDTADTVYQPTIPRARDPHVIPSPGLFHEIRQILLTSWNLKWRLLVSFSPYLAVLVAFVAFVRWNGGIVLGAKDAHTVSPHFAQIMYFGLVSALFTAPLHFTLSQAAILVRSFWNNRPLSTFQSFSFLSVGALSVHFFSVAHPYLLADNRHYPFYLWRKVIKVHWSAKYLLVPVYAYSWFSIISILAKSQKKIWVLIYFLASAAVLIPAPLIEFRYFTIPFFFLVLHSNTDDYKSWFLIGMLYAAINAFTMMMFLFRPFHWNHEPGVQRFIW